MTAAMPPSSAGGDYSMKPRGNGPAVASLVCSLILCVPGLGILGIIFGFIGLNRSKETASGGGLAIAGIIIGVLSLILWGGIGYGSYKGFLVTRNAVVNLKSTIDAQDATAERYVTALTKGDLSTASDEASSVSSDQLARESQMLKPLGALKHMSYTNHNWSNGTLTLTGTATFENGQKDFTFTMTGSSTKWKIASVEFQ